eukprot:scaffold176193_cov35-Tisochrysis_lutea.AAC.1
MTALLSSADERKFPTKCSPVPRSSMVRSSVFREGNGRELRSEIGYAPSHVVPRRALGSPSPLREVLSLHVR